MLNHTSLYLLLLRAYTRGFVLHNAKVPDLETVGMVTAFVQQVGEGRGCHSTARVSSSCQSSLLP